MLQSIQNTINLTRSINSDKNELYVLGYLMQEYGEFVEAVVAVECSDSKFIPDHNHHVLEEAADVIQNVFSHLAMVSDDTPDNIYNTVLIDTMGNIQDGTTTNSSIADPNQSLPAKLGCLSSALGNFAQSSMIVQGHITHKTQPDDTMWVDAASVINNVFVLCRTVYSSAYSNADLQSAIFDWLDKKNVKWLTVSSKWLNI